MKTWILFLLSILCVQFSLAKEPSNEIRMAFNMVSQHKLELAEKYAKNALVDAEKRDDRFNQGEAQVVLGLVYKSKKYERYEESIINLRNAISSFRSINYLAGVSKAKFSLGNAYGAINDNYRRCAMYKESLEDYWEGQRINSDEVFMFNPAYKSFEHMVNEFVGAHC